MTRAYSGSRAKRWSQAVLSTKGLTCQLRIDDRCTLIATEADHIEPVSLRPDLAYDIANGRPACRHCNAKRGNRPFTDRPTISNEEWFT